MDAIIRSMQERDTEGNIINLQREIDQLASINNPLKKSLSMYKIK